MAIKSYQKDGKKFFEIYLNAFDKNGKRLQVRKRGFPSLREAEAGEFEVKRELCDKKENPSYTWKQWHSLYIDRIKLELEPSTVLNHDLQMKKWVNPVWGDKPLSEISPSDVHDMVFSTVKDVSDNTRLSIMKTARRILQVAVEDGVLDRNPAMKIKVKVAETKGAVLNATEVEIFLREARATGHRFYEIWAVALFTGMRSGELYALKWSDIDFENKRISVTKSWNSKRGIGPTKSTKNRVVPISGQLERLLKEMKLKAGPADEFVLPHIDEWTRGDQALITREFCEAVGVTSIKFHDLRATVITQLLLKGVPLAQVMAIVGHSKLSTTDRYLRIVGTDVQGATEKLTYSLPQEQLATILEFRGQGKLEC